MLVLKLLGILSLGLFSVNLLAHQTILGFEDTLNYEDKARLEKFISDHKKLGHTPCRYDHSEDTVICEDSKQQIRHIFR